MPFRQAFDLKTRRLHFYVETKFFGQEIVDAMGYAELTNDDRGIFGGAKSLPVMLNLNRTYVNANLIRDVQGVSVRTKETEIP